MNTEEALRLSQRFPEDKTVPKKIAKAIKECSGEEKYNLQRIAEGLIVDAITPDDIKLVDKYLFSKGQKKIILIR